MGGLLLLCGLAVVLATVTGLLLVMVYKVKQARRASSRPGCYYCGSPAVRLAAPAGLVDWLLENWDCLPHRCEICFQRYYRYVRKG